MLRLSKHITDIKRMRHRVLLLKQLKSLQLNLTVTWMKLVFMVERVMWESEPVKKLGFTLFEVAIL